MQYVRNLSDSVSTAWNSINPATLSGAIDVIVVEQADGTLACSPFHVRFGKFSLLRPYEKKVEFKVNGKKQDYAMKLGEAGEAFFVFETSDTIPQSLQTSPLVSPVSSPPLEPSAPDRSTTMPLGLQEPPLLELDPEQGKERSASFTRPPPGPIYSSSVPREPGMLQPVLTSPELSSGRPLSDDWSAFRPHSDDILRKTARRLHIDSDLSDDADGSIKSDRSHSPPRPAPRDALERAMNLSRELQAVNIPTRVTETGDLMLDMTGFKNNEEDALRAEIQARKVLSEELEGDYDIGALFGMDDQGNLWIYGSEEAKDAAMKRTMESAAGLRSQTFDVDAVSDPGYHSDDSSGDSAAALAGHRRTESDVGQGSLQTPPSSPGSSKATGGGSNLNYAKTLRLTSDQLKGLNLKYGENSLSFTVNRSTCSCFMWLWKHDTPVVISDIDGTITKSDALGHVLNMIGRDWTHAGVAKLYNDIMANGYNIMYLTSRSVGQADFTRAYLSGIVQDGYRLPRGPTILSPDRTMAALRREVYLRKPHVFKMATLRDIRQLYGSDSHPFYAGFGNRLTDQISYRTVDVPRTRIFTINSNAEVSLDLLSLNKLKLSYVSMTDVVDHYFPPVSMIVNGGEEYTDFAYWRDQPLDMDEFSASESESGGRPQLLGDQASQYAEDEDEDEDEDEEVEGDGMADSYISRASYDDGYAGGSVLSGDYEGEEEAGMMGSMMEALEDTIEGDAVEDDTLHEALDEEDADDEEDDDDDDDDNDDEEEEEEEEEEREAKEEEEKEEEVEVEEETVEEVEKEEEKEAEKEDNKDDEAEVDQEEQQHLAGLAPPKSAIPPRTPSPKIAVEDLNAEMITGMTNLSMEREVDE